MGTSPGGCGADPGSSTSPVFGWRTTLGTSGGTPLHVVPASFGLAGLWHPLDYSSKWYKHPGKGTKKKGIPWSPSFAGFEPLLKDDFFPLDNTYPVQQGRPNLPHGLLRPSQPFQTSQKVCTHKNKLIMVNAKVYTPFGQITDQDIQPITMGRRSLDWIDIPLPSITKTGQWMLKY